MLSVIAGVVLSRRRGFHRVAETIDQVIDGEQFGFAVGHAQLDAVFGLDDEVVGALDFLGREGVDILTLWYSSILLNTS